MTADVIVLLDVDNTLLDNDHFIRDLRDRLQCEFGAASAQDYWTIFDAMREELGYVDYLGALQRFRFEIAQSSVDEQRLLLISAFILNYPFADRLYPRALEVIKHLDGFGQTVILSDGDVVLQPHKLQRSGLLDAVDGRALIYVHKEQMLDAIQHHYPARHYVMVDDKLSCSRGHESDLARTAHHHFSAPRSLRVGSRDDCNPAACRLHYRAYW